MTGLSVILHWANGAYVAPAPFAAGYCAPPA